MIYDDKILYAPALTMESRYLIEKLAFGRPSKGELAQKKRRWNLAENVANNCTNAKDIKMLHVLFCLVYLVYHHYYFCLVYNV